jgi:hypothetical protein
LHLLPGSIGWPADLAQNTPFWRAATAVWPDYQNAQAAQRVFFYGRR